MGTNKPEKLQTHFQNVYIILGPKAKHSKPIRIIYIHINFFSVSVRLLSLSFSFSANWLPMVQRIREMCSIWIGCTLNKSISSALLKADKKKLQPTTIIDTNVWLAVKVKADCQWLILQCKQIYRAHIPHTTSIRSLKYFTTNYNAARTNIQTLRFNFFACLIHIRCCTFSLSLKKKKN